MDLIQTHEIVVNTGICEIFHYREATIQGNTYLYFSPVPPINRALQRHVKKIKVINKVNKKSNQLLQVPVITVISYYILKTLVNLNIYTHEQSRIN